MPVDFKKFKESITSFLTDKSSKEDQEKVSSLVKMCDEAEADQTKLAESCESYRQKYVDAVVNGAGGKGEPTPEVKTSEEPKSLEDIIDDIESKREKK